MIVQPKFTEEDHDRLLRVISETIGLSYNEIIFSYVNYFLEYINAPLKFRIESDLARNNFANAQVRIDKWLFDNLELNKVMLGFQNLQIATPDDNNYKENDLTFEIEEEYFFDSESKYSGSYASDIAGLSDDFIDDVFGGDPDAYWNID